MKILVILICYLIINTAQAVPLVTLKDSNFAALNTEVNDNNINAIIEAVHTSDKNLPFYIYIDSPGGDVFGALRLIEVLKAQSHVVCISNKAMSAAYLITQACPTRLVLSTSVFMWHRVKISGSSKESSQLQTEANFTNELDKIGDRLVATRLGITIEELVSKKNPEFWTVGANNLIATKQADAETLVTCDLELAKKRIEVLIEVGPFLKTIEKSACPI